MTQTPLNHRWIAPVFNNNSGFWLPRHHAIHGWSTLLALSAMLSGQPVRAVETNALATPPSWLVQPISMADAISIALLRNSAIRKGQSDLEAAYGIIIQTRAVALPKLRATSHYDHTEAVEQFPFPTPHPIIPPKDEWSGDIRIVQNIYEGGRIRSALRTARLTKAQALLQYSVVVADSLLDLRTAYYTVLQTQQQIVVHEASVTLLSQQLENTTHRFEAGTVPHFDVLRAEVEVANARPKLIRAKNQYRIAKNNLATLLGYNIPPSILEDVPLTLTSELEAEPYNIQLPGAIGQAMERRPELGVLRKAEGLRKEDIIVAKSGSRPIVDIFAGYGGRNSVYQNNLFADVAGAIAGVEFTWDIFDGNLTKGKVVTAKAYYEKAQLDLDDMTRRIELEVRTAYSTLIEAREVLESQKKVKAQAEEALRLASSRYEAGTGTQLDVLNAQTSLTEARTTQIQALYDYDVDRARLERAIGQDVPREIPRGENK